MSYNVVLLPHPHLYAGFDDWGVALDEINGAGWNDAMEVYEFDSSYVTHPMVLTYPFVIECAEFTVNGEKQEFAVPWEPRRECVGDVA